MTFIKYGNDIDRLTWAQEKRSKCKSMDERILVAQQLSSKFAIDSSKGLSMYTSHHLDGIVSDVVNDAHNMVNNTPLVGWKNNKPYLKMDYVTNETLNLDSPIMKLALHQDIISAVAKYIGHIPILFTCKLWYSRSIPTRDYDGSQLFHCDWEDIKSVKIFVNVSDITEKDGPLTIIPADRSKDIRNKLNYKFGPEEYYLSDEIINQYTSKDYYVEAVGPKGTLSFVDTCSCFHYGSRVEDTRSRITFLIQYISPAAINLDPKYTNTNMPFKHLAKQKLSDMNKLLLGGL